MGLTASSEVRPPLESVVPLGDLPRWKVRSLLYDRVMAAAMAARDELLARQHPGDELRHEATMVTFNALCTTVLDALGEALDWGVEDGAHG